MLRWIRVATLVLPMLGYAWPALAQQELPRPEPPRPAESPQLGGTVPSWLQRWSRVNQRSSTLVKAVFRDVIANARGCTVQITSNGKLTALGAIVSPDGFVLTKASEVHGDIRCTLPRGGEYSAIVVGVREDYDLAMLKIAAQDLPMVSWCTEPEPEPGSWLATPGGEPIPVAIGVVSASARKIAPHRSVLGILLAPSESGPQVTHVLPASGAAIAGLRVGDIVVSVNDKTVAEAPDLMAHIQHVKPGEKVTLQVLRADDPLQIVATLGAADASEEARRTKFQQGLGRELSKRNAGFPAALQHDSVLRPWDCGGPLVNLNGQVVGLNIASADRVTSYAIPTSEILPLLPKLMSGELAPADSHTRWRAFLSQASQLQASLAKHEQQLQQLQGLITSAEASGRTAKAVLEKQQDDAAAQSQFAQARQQYQQARAEISKVEAGVTQLRQKLATLPTSGFELATP